MKYAHLIIGFPIYDYFRNSITSVLENDTNYESCLLIYSTFSNSENNKIINYIKKVKVKYPKRKIIFKYSRRANRKEVNKKTVGNLYEGMNFALKYCINNEISILNIIQNDMQLMFWNNNIPKLAQEIFKKNKLCVHLATGFIRKGSHPNFYKKNHKTKSFFLNSIKKKCNLIFNKTAIGDWGIYNIKKLNKINFQFEKNETFIGNNLRDKKNFLGIYLPIPFVGVIPWPACVRNCRIYGNIIRSRNLFLSLVHEECFSKLLKLKKIPFQEDMMPRDKCQLVVNKNYLVAPR